MCAGTSVRRSVSAILVDKMNPMPRSRWVARIWLLIALLPFMFVSIWISLQLESVYQRRKAESFIRDLKQFPFASAGFVTVREFVLTHSGRPIQQPFPFQPRVYGMAGYGPDGKTIVPFSVTQPACTIQDCTFEIRIANAVEQVLYKSPSMRFLINVCQSAGIHPWVVQTQFEVAGGKLQGTRTVAGQIRAPLTDDAQGVPPIEYVVNTSTPARADPNSPYRIGVPHITGSQEQLLVTRIAQLDSVPMERALDIDLHCLTAVSRTCTGFHELAPSAWADYVRERQNQQ
jgi:hypothetical protein